jgi:hypothetical protein
MPVAFSISKTRLNGSFPLSHLKTVDLSTAGLNRRPKLSSVMSLCVSRNLVIGDFFAMTTTVAYLATSFKRNPLQKSLTLKKTSSGIVAQ